MSKEWLKMSVTALGSEIGRGEIDPVDLVSVFFDQIEKHPFSDRIYARLSHDRAFAEAKGAAMRAKSGRRLGHVDGVPVSWKDLFDTAGVATEAGSKLLQGRVPSRDAKVLRNATALGMVCLGKTHMSELAFSGLGLNPVTKTTPCVNDHDAVSGGSSSGAAGSVAFDLAPAGIGSDTGGSVRIPAAWNDLAGLKTTSGRLALEGVVPLVARFDTVGPLARSVEDAALLMRVLEGRPPIDLRGASLRDARFLVLDNTIDEVRSGPRTGFEGALEKISQAGAVLARGKIDAADRALDLSAVLFTTEAYATWKDQIEAAPDKMFSEILARFRAGGRFSGCEFVQAWQQLEVFREAFWQQAAGCDAVLLPTSAILPPNIDRLLSDRDYYVEENLLSLKNTRIGNLMGACALTLPTDQPSCGMMLLSKPFSEEKLLRMGHAVQGVLSSDV